MEKKEMKECCNDCGVCGMHLCKKCTLPVLMFGLLFIVAGTGVWVGAPVWFNMTTVLGLFMALWAAMSMMKL